MKFDVGAISPVLLFTLNVIGGLMLRGFSDLEKKIETAMKFGAETRRKLDEHCEDFELHGLKRA